jgi:hypothetical protein
MFGICWDGGAGEFEVIVHDATGQIVLHESGLAAGSSELIKASTPVVLQPGAYKLEVDDQSGDRAVGSFTVVDPSTLPAPSPVSGRDAAVVQGAQSLGQGDITLSYEAYLRVLPLAQANPQSDAARLVTQLCHRSP